jgi:Fur family transcriptional regulator, ferric uptake regulator
VTRGRLEILGQLEREQRFVSALELHDALVLRGLGVGLSTVYRGLQSLTTAGALHTVVIHGEVAYRRCRSGHHHHVVCPECGVVDEDRSPLVEEWVWEVCRRSGGDPGSHRVDAFLRCSRCAADLAATRLGAGSTLL